MRLSTSAGAVLALVVTLAACAAKRPVKTAPPLPPPSTEGKTSYNYIFDPANSALALPEDVKFLRPQPVETKRLPTYPERALAAGDGPHREIVRIVIDVHGTVGQVLDSPLGRSDDGPFAADYRQAVDDAVKSWRYEPGVLEHVRDGEDKDLDGKPDYRVLTSLDRVAVYYDIRFTFEIVDGKGVVKPTP
jgi:hypothetical protein